MKILAFTLLGAYVLSAQIQGAFSPVPIWPSSGEPSGDLANGSFVFFDPRTEDYVLHFPEGIGTERAPSGRMITTRVQLQNRAIPTLSVNVTSDLSGGYRYVYSIANASRAKSPISTWALVVPGSDDSVKLSHRRWQSFADVAHKPAVAPQAGFQEGGPPELKRNVLMGKFVRWSAPADDLMIRAGRADADFTLVSDYRPGWTTAYVGGGEGLRFSQSVPAVVLKQLEELQKPENYYTYTVTFGPKYGPADTDQWIASDWSFCIEKLISRRLLNGEAPFVQNVMALLRTVSEGAVAQGLALSAAPTTPMEAEVAAGIRLSLRLK